MKVRYIILTLLMAASLQPVTAGNSRRLDSVDGTVWQLCPQDSLAGVAGTVVSTPGFVMTSCTVEGAVPGCVFTAYVNAGLEDTPEYGDNIWRADEAFYSRPFWYRAEVETPTEYSDGKRVWLQFDNTNRYADFYFNGVKISGTPESTRDVSGHMMRSRFDVTPYLAPDRRNVVAVLITDADQKKTRNADGPYGVACSPSYLAGAGWDWMPYIPGRLNGIVGHVKMDVTGDVVMVDPWVRNDLPTNDLAELTISTQLKNTTDRQRRVTLEAVINPGDIKVERTYVVPAGSEPTVKLDSKLFPELAIANPRLWWPAGYGDPNLYTLDIKVKDGRQVLDERKIDFGIKKYEYTWDKNNVGMPVMNLWVNGQRVFVKGGNWGMSEYLLRCHDDEYEKKIRLHHDLNYNMIRLWTGCVTDDEFYDYCDRYGIMVWNDFWLYVAFNDVAEPEAFIANAEDKVRRLRNHPSIALWCGANETHPVPYLDAALAEIVNREDRGDRLYKSCSNQDGLSGSGWWANMPPRHHFSTSGSNLAFNKPSYPYGIDYGYGMRSEIGMATFPAYESVKLFIPEENLWPLPTDDELQNQKDNVWNKHFFGNEAWNAKPTNYTEAVNDRWGTPGSIEEFCEKAQLVNIEDMKGMYEAWNDKMWNDAAGLLIWMSHPAYPSFVWQTYDYYYDPTGAYWGAKKACEHVHIQWNALNNSVKAINSGGTDLTGLTAEAVVRDINGKVLKRHVTKANVSLPASSNTEVFTIDFPAAAAGVQFIELSLRDADGNLLSDNFYWHNSAKELDYTAINTLPDAKVSVTATPTGDGRARLTLRNDSKTVAFANRVRLLDAETGERILPVLMDDNYITLMPGAEREIEVDYRDFAGRPVDVMLKQYSHPERKVAKI